MTAPEIVGIVFGAISILGGILYVWIQTQLKIKSIEKDIASINVNIKKIEDDAKDDKIEIYKLIAKNNDNVIEKLDRIDIKLDKQFEDITVLRTEHNQRTQCYYEKKIKKEE